MGSLWTSTSSLGFPGGSLGHPGAAGVVMFICRPLRPYVGSCCLEQRIFASACCNVGSVTSGCHLLSFSIIRVELYDFVS